MRPGFDNMREEHIMNIIKNQEGTTLTIKLDDRLDTITAPQMDADLKSCLDGVETLI